MIYASSTRGLKMEKINDVFSTPVTWDMGNKFEYIHMKKKKPCC